MKFILKYKLLLLGVAIGAAGGYLYYYLIGCHAGSCLITSSPVNSTVYGGLLGGLLFNTFKKEEKTKTE